MLYRRVSGGRELVWVGTCCTGEREVVWVGTCCTGECQVRGR